MNINSQKDSPFSGAERVRITTENRVYDWELTETVGIEFVPDVWVALAEVRFVEGETDPRIQLKQVVPWRVIEGVEFFYSTPQPSTLETVN